MKEVVFASGEPDYLEDKHHSQQMVVCFAIEAVVFASESISTIQPLHLFKVTQQDQPILLNALCSSHSINNTDELMDHAYNPLAFQH